MYLISTHYLSSWLVFLFRQLSSFNGVDGIVQKILTTFSALPMSDSETQDASVLGKRARNNPEDIAADDSGPVTKKLADEIDESDVDVGPMPVPAGAGVVKKKRKGSSAPLFHSMTFEITDKIFSSSSRASVSGTSTQCRSILQVFHAPRHHKFCCDDEVRLKCCHCQWAS